MPIEIAGIKINRIHKLVTLEKAAFVHHHIPGQEGNVTQNLGRESVCLQVEGIFYGPKAADDLEKLRGVYLKRDPVDFIADILGKSYASKVTLDHFEVTSAALEPDQYSYILIVTEFVQPPKTSLGTTDINLGIQNQAAALLDAATLPNALSLGSLPEITNPFVPLKGALDPVKAASSGLMDSMNGLKKLLG